MNARPGDTEGFRGIWSRPKWGLATDGESPTVYIGEPLRCRDCKDPDAGFGSRGEKGEVCHYLYSTRLIPIFEFVDLVIAPQPRRRNLIYRANISAPGPISAISAINFLMSKSPKELKSFATKTKAPGPLSIRVTVLKAVPSKSKLDRGAVTSFVEVINQASEVVMTFKIVNIIAKRSS